MQITGPVHTWRVGPHSRRYSVVTLPYREMLGAAQASLYDAVSGLGEQRSLKPTHARRLTVEMEQGTYTPTSVSVSLREVHQPVYKGESFSLDIQPEEPLALVDGGHRLAAIGRLLEQAEKRKALARSYEEESAAQEDIEQLLSLPVTAVVHLDGDPQRDFINLQAGLNVDKAHILSLRLQKLFDDPVMHLAFELARSLNEENGSPFKDLVRFDSYEDRQSVVRKLPISTLCARSASDGSFSCVGWARVAHSFDLKARDCVRWLVDSVRVLSRQAAEALGAGMVLTPPRDGGTRGGATLLVGVGIVMTYRLGANQRRKPSEKDHNLLVDAVCRTLAVQSAPEHLSAQGKRQLMGAFARLVLADREGEEEMVDGLPRGLLELTSRSAWNVQN